MACQGLWRSDLVQLVKIGVQSRGMGRYILNVVCFFLCPDADCLRNNLYGAIKSEFERVLNMNKEWSELNKTMQAQIKRKILIRGVLILYLLYEVS